MKDVKEIINNIFIYGKLLSILFVLITLLCVKRYKLNVYSVFKLSSIIYTFIVITIALGFLISFNKMFIIFHEIAFSNDLCKIKY